MRISDHTASEWTGLGLVFIVLGIALGITVSPLVGLVMLVLGILIVLRVKLRIGAAPKRDETLPPA